MQKGKYIWMDGKFIPWKQAKIHVLSHSLHYGASVFEGIKIYPKGVFRLDGHLARFYDSMKAISMKPTFSKSEFTKACIEIVRKNKISLGYLRPIAFYGEGGMNLFWKDMPVKMAIIAIPWKNYLAGEIKIKTSKWRRISPGTVALHAKVSGHYVNSNLATTEAYESGADEALLFDEKGHVAEAASANIFFVKNGEVFTSKRDFILPGFSRDSVICLAKDLGLKVYEKNMKKVELKTFDEAFLTGTASEIVSICEIDGRKLSKEHPVTDRLKVAFKDAVSGKNMKYRKWLTRV